MRFRVLYAVASCLLLAACSPGRLSHLADKVMKDSSQFNRVGSAWLLKNGRLIDSSKKEVFVKKDTVKITMHDTVKQKVPCDSFTAVTKNGDSVKVNSQGELSLKHTQQNVNTVDSTLFWLFDQGLYNESEKARLQCEEDRMKLQDENDALRAQVKQMEKQSKWDRISKWAGYAIALLGLIVLIIILLKRL